MKVYAKRIISVFMSAVMLLSFMAQIDFSAYADVSGDYEYTVLDDGTAEITKYLGSDANVTIPAELDGYIVTSIGKDSFNSRLSIVYLTVGNNIKTIGKYAFASCNSLKNVRILDGVTTICSEAFKLCQKLSSVTIGSTVTEIAYDAFFICNSLTNITVDANNPSFCDIDGNLFNKEKTTLLKYATDKPNETYTIPDSVTTIENQAFRFCKNITSVTIPDSVTTIGNEAFGDCSNLVNVQIGNNVAKIGAYAFLNCKSLTNIVLGNSVTIIGSSAFSSCSSLASITIGNSLSEVKSDAFSGCNSLTDAYYMGSEEDWKWIYIDPSRNDCLTNATIHYNYSFEHSHTWNDGEITVAPTCTKEGEIKFTCTACSETKTEPIPAAEHNYTQNVVAPTCKAQGCTVYSCSACGYSYQDDYVNQLEHDFSNNAENCRYDCGEKNPNYVLPTEPETTKPTTTQPVTTKPTQPTTTEPTATKPATTKPTTTKPITTKPVTTKPTTTQPATTKPTTTKSTNANQTTTTKPVTTSPTTVLPTSVNPGETEPGSTKPVATKPESAHPITTNPPVIESTTNSQSVGVNKDCKHSNVSYQIIKKATFTADGARRGVCSVCGKALSNEVINKISKVALSKSSLSYNGKILVKPAVIAKDSKGNQIGSESYKVSYVSRSNNKTINKLKSIGQYVAVVEFKGEYSGIKKMYFCVKPKKPSVKSLKTGGRSITALWKKSKDINGYQIVIASDKKFTKNKKSKNAAKKSSACKFSRLKKGKKYYVKIRSYKVIKVNGRKAKIYSDYAPAKAIKCI